MRRRVARRAVALADLEDRDVVAALAEVGRDDLEQAADQALAQDRVLARQRVGDGDRPAGRALLRLAVERRRRRGPGTARRSAARRGRTSRPRSGRRRRASRGRRRGPRAGRAVGRHRRVRQAGRDELVAADAGDLLGDVGLDREVAPPGRDGRVDDLVRRRARRRAASCPAATADARPGGRPAPSRCRPGRAARAARRSRSRRPEQPVDARRPERDVRRRRARPGSSRRAPGATVAAGPLGDEPRRPVRADPREPELLALLEAEARLGAEGVAEGRPADADRVEDGRLDDDVGRRLARPRTRRRP